MSGGNAELNRSYLEGLNLFVKGKKEQTMVHVYV